MHHIAQKRFALALKVMREETCATKQQQDEFTDRLFGSTDQLTYSEVKARGTQPSLKLANEYVAEAARHVAYPEQQAELEKLLAKHDFIDPPKPTVKTVRVLLDVQVEDPTDSIGRGGADGSVAWDLQHAVAQLGRLGARKLVGVRFLQYDAQPVEGVAVPSIRSHTRSH